MRNHVLRAVLLVSTLWFVACQQQGIGASTVTISAISPDLQKGLTAGQHVRLSVDISYTLDAESGTLRLVVQSAGGSVLASEVEVVTRGSANATLLVDFDVPHTYAIKVFAALLGQGQTETTTVDFKALKVAP